MVCSRVIWIVKRLWFRYEKTGLMIILQWNFVMDFQTMRSIKDKGCGA